MQLLASISEQTLSIINDEGETIRRFPMSSALNGTGCEEGSYCTPLGLFEVAEKHGDSAPEGTIFRSRKPEGQWTKNEPTDSDLVLSRILWLNGLETHNANTKDRYIYIHGTNHEDTIGTPTSAGCLRMKNSDIIELYNLIDEGTQVLIS